MIRAKIIGLSDLIEEEVLLDINGLEFAGFIIFCPYKITLNNTYPIKIHAIFLDEENYKQIEQPKYGLQKIDNNFSYIVCGKVCSDGSINIGQDVTIQTENILSDTPYLIDKFVELKVDRLSIEFL